MYTRFRSTIFFIIATPILFGVGAISAIRGGWANETIAIEVKNLSNSPATLVEIEITTCGITRNIQQRLVTSDDVKSTRETIHFEILICGEASHKTRVTLANGKVIESVGNSYLQSGTTITDYVHDDRVSGVSALGKP